MVQVTELLKQAIDDLLKLPDETQEEAADLLFNLMAKKNEPIKLDPESRAAIRRGREQARLSEFASDEEMTAFFTQHKG